MTLIDLLDDHAAKRPDAIFLNTDNGPVTFAEIAESSRLLANGLENAGIVRGDRVAIAGPNCREWLDFLFGALRIGALVVTLNVRYRDTELVTMLNQSEAKLVVTPELVGGVDLRHLYGKIASRVPSLDRVYYLESSKSEDHFSDLCSGETSFEEIDVEPDDPAVILYTSGTTGKPKGAVLTHKSILASARAQVDRLGLTSNDVMYGVMPLNHVGGLTCTVAAMLVVGGQIQMPLGFSPNATAEALVKPGVTVFAGVPAMWTWIVRQAEQLDTRSATLRLAIVGGSNADLALCEAITATFPDARLSNLYGLSESSGAVVLSAREDTPDIVSSTLGTPLSGVETKVVGDDGDEVALGTDGELHIRGEAVINRYWNDQEASAAALDAEGWLATGDIVSQDSYGHVVMRGRKKEMFLQGGFNVYPVEVENLLTQYPGVVMAAGIGVPHQDLGDVGHYFIVVAEGHENFSTDGLIEFCRDHLADYKVPRAISVVDELPQTPTGKIAKAVLKNWAVS